MLSEMKGYPQWVVWRALNRDGKIAKVPFSPKHGRPASVTNPDDWGTYEEAISAKENTGAAGVGFVLTANDPFCFIDLDSTEKPDAFSFQKQIFERIDTYAELSPSGKGLHLICKAKVGAGVRCTQRKVEIYDRERYMTVTESIYRRSPIVDHQELVTSLVTHLRPSAVQKVPTAVVVGAPETISDEALLNTASQAANGSKFQALWAGHWEEYYQSQSEADFALVNILAFYTESKEQVRRMFLQSALANRKKAENTGYVQTMVDRSFDRKLPNIDLVALREAFVAQEEEEGFDFNFDCRLPGGLVEQIALYTYAASPRPNPEVALATAIAILAGITGRAYNVYGTGLNQYIFLIGATGIGKDAINVGLGGIFKRLAEVLPGAKGFLGPSEISSPQALFKHIANTSNSFVAYTGEIGKKFAEMGKHNASPSTSGLLRMALNLYAASGKGKTIEGTIYSDSQKNVNALDAPAFTWFGESTPDTFFSSLSSEMISDGLIPRFLVIETTRLRPPLNTAHHTVRPDDAMMGQISSLAATALALNKSNGVIDVLIDPQAEKLLNAFNEECDKRINKAIMSGDSIRNQLWNRAHLKAAKLAALVAVGKNHIAPTITRDEAQWAIDVERWEIGRISKRFDAGDISSNGPEEMQLNQIRKRIRAYLTGTFEDVKSYMKGQERLHAARVIPHSYFVKSCSQTALFKNDKLGASVSIKKTLRAMIDMGEIREVPQEQMYREFGARGLAYVVEKGRI